MTKSALTNEIDSKIKRDRLKLAKLKKIARNFKRLKHTLRERLQEEHCLTIISRLIENQEKKPETIIQEIILTLPQAWSISALMCACLEMKTKNFKPADCPGKANIKLHYDHIITNGTRGILKFCCKEPPPREINPFDQKKKKFCRLAAGRLKELLSRTELIQKIAVLEEKIPLSQDNAADRPSKVQTLNPIIGQSPLMIDLKKVIEKAAASDANVIIYGDPGGGKELAARTIHSLSKRSNKPFMVLNCSAIPPHFLEYNLSNQDSPTAASLPKNLGNLPAVDGGTLFLDIVGELSLELQARFLRLLNKEELFHDFDESVRPLNVRIIAATNRNLSTDMHLGRVRADFFYRLHAIPIAIPPLRDHPEDIPLLVNYFLTAHSPPLRPDAVPRKIMETLMNYHWPGNVRELKNVLYNYIDMGKLEIGHPSFDDSKTKGPPGTDREFRSLQEILNAAEREYILKTLQKTNWNRQKTAALLKITRNSLFRKIKEYGLDSIQNVSK